MSKYFVIEFVLKEKGKFNLLVTVTPHSSL